MCLTYGGASSDFTRRFSATILLVLLLSTASTASDWPQWGRDACRNAVSPEKNPSLDFAFPFREDGKPANPGRNIAWQADLGTRTFVPPVVADGLVWVCTNARNPDGDEEKIPEKDWGGGVLMCFREADGKLLWKHRTPRLSGRGVRDYEDARYSPIGSAPLIEGDRLWYVNNRSEVVCYDIAPLKNGIAEPRHVWALDMRKEFKVFPQVEACVASTQGFGPSVGGYKDYLYVGTRNSASTNDGRVPSPDAPSLLCLEKATGKLVWKDSSPGKGILESQHSSPLIVEVNGKPQLVVGQGDGWLRSFDGATGKLIWKCDLNWKDAKWWREDQGRLFVDFKDERNYMVATPVFHDGRIYVGTGRHFEWFAGPATLFCIDPTKRGDISLELEDGPRQGKPNPNSGVVWHTPRKVPDDAPRVEVGNKKKSDLLRDRDFYFCRTTASVTVHDGLLYAADVMGFLYCFDAKSGKLYWVDDMKANVFGQPLWIDGKVIVTTLDGNACIYAHGKERKLLKKVETEDRPFEAGAIYANGTLYLTRSDKLFAIRKPK
ncbi:MAG: PQQ-binding-like beta-propeller repeat protein [Fimbriiglobus sp.]